MGMTTAWAVIADGMEMGGQVLLIMTANCLHLPASHTGRAGAPELCAKPWTALGSHPGSQRPPTSGYMALSSLPSSSSQGFDVDVGPGGWPDPAAGKAWVPQTEMKLPTEEQQSEAPA